MNAFGEALNLVFMRWSWDFSSYSQANGLNLRLHSHEFKSLFPCQWISGCLSSSPYSKANESQTAFPWVQVSLPMDSRLRLHSHEFLFLSQWISDCIPMSPYPLPNFGVFWLGTTHVLPSWFRNVRRRSKKLHSGAILGVPLYIPHGYP